MSKVHRFILDYMTELGGTIKSIYIIGLHSGVAQRLCNGLTRDGPGFDSRWVLCKNRASRPSQWTVNGGAVS